MYTIELKYYNPNSGYTGHYFFPNLEVKVARDYLNDAMKCGCEIQIWRLIPTDRISIK